MGAKKNNNSGGGKADAASKGKGKDAGGKGAGGKGGKAGGKGGGADEQQKSGKQSKAGGQWIIARHILVAKEGKRNEAEQKIQAMIDEGTKKGRAAFSEVAKEYSEDKARQGGLMARATKGSLLPEFEEVAYALPETGENDKVPHMGKVKTSEGYHLIIVDKRG